MLSTQSVSVTSRAVLVLLTGKIFPFGEAGFAMPAVEGRSGILCFLSAVVSELVQEGTVSRGCSWPCRDSGNAGGCAVGLGCSHVQGEHCSTGELM